MTYSEAKSQFPLGSIVSYNNEYYYVVGYDVDEDKIAIAYKENKNSPVDQVSFFVGLGYNETDMIEAINRAGISKYRIFRIVEFDEVELEQKPGDMIDGKEISGSAGSSNVLKYDSSSDTMDYTSDVSFSNNSTIQAIALADTDAVREAALEDNDAVMTDLKIQRSLEAPFYAGQAFDLGTSGPFVDAFYDGRYVYFLPGYSDGDGPGDRAVRLDPLLFFGDPEESLSILETSNYEETLMGFGGGFVASCLDGLDGFAGFLVPNENEDGKSGEVCYFSLNDFGVDFGGLFVDLTETDPDLKGFYGGFTDGRYGYFVPYNNGSAFGKVARIDLYSVPGDVSVSVLDLTTTDSDLKGFRGGFISGGYGYFVPYNNGSVFGKVARVDLSDFSTVSVLDLTETDPDLKGFCGGAVDGRYGYLFGGKPSIKGAVVRIDLNDFTTVKFFNMADFGGGVKRFEGGCIAGDFLYLTPAWGDHVAVRVPIFKLFR